MIPRTISVALGLSTLLLVPISCVRAAPKTAAEIPVRWSVDGLIPDYVDVKPRDVSEFTQVFRRPWVDAPRVILKRGVEQHQVPIESCARLLEIGPHVWDTVQPLTYKELAQLRAMCGAVQRISRMKPSRTSYVSWDVKSLLQDLPQVTLGARERGDGPGFEALKQIGAVDCDASDSCKVTTPSGWFVFTVVGSGDFDGDGVEDLMVIFSAGPLQGTLASTHGIILSRLKRSGLKALDVW
jgi:hypothetical protein